MNGTLEDDQVETIRHRRADGESLQSLAEDYDCTPQNISLICRGELYKNTSGPRTRMKVDHPTAACIDCGQETLAAAMVGTEHGLVCSACTS